MMNLRDLKTQHCGSGTPSAARSCAGFTLVEILVAISVILIGVSAAVGGLTMINRYAMTNRLLTAANNVVRDQLDRVQSESPFRPAVGEIPESLRVGTHTILPPGYAAAEPPKFALYQDEGAALVQATLSSTVTDTGTLGLYSALVTVSFEFRGRTYSVSGNSMRASDE